MPDASLHLTLAFLGERSQDDAAAVGAALAGVARPVVALSLGAARWLPPRRPRVLAVDVVDGDGALGALQAALVAALGAAIGYVPEHPEYLAHVTVARVRGRAPLAARAARRELPPVDGMGPFAAPALTLMRSRTDPDGARYEALARVELDAEA